MFHVVATRGISVLINCSISWDCVRGQSSPSCRGWSWKPGTQSSWISKAPFGYECAGRLSPGFSQGNPFQVFSIFPAEGTFSISRWT